MNKKSLIILLIITVLIGAGIYFFNKNYKSNNEKNYEATRTSTTKSNIENIISKETLEKNNTPQYSEEQIATFSTTIYSKDSARQNNIQITCNTLNGTTIKNGDTFSFCNIVGQSTTAKGYQEAEIFDRHGNKKMGLRWW